MKPAHWIIVVLILVAVAVGIVLARRQRSAAGFSVMPYGDIRSQMFKNIGDPGDTATCPPRPAGLDCRLSADDEAELRQLAPLAKEDGKEVWDCYYRVVQSIERELESIDANNGWYQLLSPARRAVLAARWLEAEVNNGGFDQYYLNSAGDGAAAAPDALRMLGREDVADLVELANARFPSGPPESRPLRLYQMGQLTEEAASTWSDLDSQFYALPSIDLDATVAFILAHPKEFFRPPSSD